MKLAIAQSPRTWRAFAPDSAGDNASASDSFARKKGNLRSAVAFARYSAMGRKSMRWADGFIAVDWGTTNRRAYRLDSSGKCTQEFEDHKGVLTLSQGGFPDAIAE